MGRNKGPGQWRDRLTVTRCYSGHVHPLDLQPLPWHVAASFTYLLICLLGGTARPQAAQARVTSPLLGSLRMPWMSTCSTQSPCWPWTLENGKHHPCL